MILLKKLQTNQALYGRGEKRKETELLPSERSDTMTDWLLLASDAELANAGLCPLAIDKIEKTKVMIYIRADGAPVFDKLLIIESGWFYNHWRKLNFSLHVLTLDQIWLPDRWGTQNPSISNNLRSIDQAVRELGTIWLLQTKNNTIQYTSLLSNKKKKKLFLPE